MSPYLLASSRRINPYRDFISCPCAKRCALNTDKCLQGSRGIGSPRKERVRFMKNLRLWTSRDNTNRFFHQPSCRCTVNTAGDCPNLSNRSWINSRIKKHTMWVVHLKTWGLSPTSLRILMISFSVKFPSPGRAGPAKLDSKIGEYICTPVCMRDSRVQLNSWKRHQSVGGWMLDKGMKS